MVRGFILASAASWWISELNIRHSHGHVFFPKARGEGFSYQIPIVQDRGSEGGLAGSILTHLPPNPEKRKLRRPPRGHGILGDFENVSSGDLSGDMAS